jgi:hypothetical protein
MKSPDLARFVVREFYPHLIPGTSLVIHQDFAHLYLWWIHLIQYHLRDCFEMFADIPRSGTMTFLYVRAISESLLRESLDFDTVSEAELDQAYAYCLGLSQEPFTRGQIAGAHVVAYLYRHNLQRAREISDNYINQGLTIEPASSPEMEFIERHRILQRS